MYKLLFVSFCAMLAGYAVQAHLVPLSPETEKFVSINEDVLAFTNVRIVDGTGADAVEGQTVIVRDGRIAEIGASTKVKIPGEAKVLDYEGKTLLPGFVMLHEHMFYPVRRGYYNNLTYSFPKLYLAGGVTTMRTGGSVQPYADLNLKQWIDDGIVPGPKIQVTGPILNGPGLPIVAQKILKGPDDARRVVSYWSEEGVDNFKVYRHLSRAEMKAIIEEAHARGHKVTGHICSITFREAADLGIDNLEHGFLEATDFVKDKEPDKCPDSKVAKDAVLGADVKSNEMEALIKHLVDNKVAITSTLPIFETFARGRPIVDSESLDAMAPQVRELYLKIWSQIASGKDEQWGKIFEREMALELAFARAGGLLLNGTDPTGYGGVVGGHANHRSLELLVEAGFTPVEAISISTLNGARYLEMDNEVGTIAVGKAADLIVIDGAPDQTISDIRKVIAVFKDGIGYDTDKLKEAAKGWVGLK